MKKNEDGQGKFPDLSGDGKVTMKDILIGRGVVKKAEGGSMSDSRKDVLLDEIKSLKDKGEDFINSPAAAELMQVYDINVKEIPLMGGGSIDEKNEVWWWWKYHDQNCRSINESSRETKARHWSSDDWH